MKKANILFLETGTPTLNGGAGGSLVSLFEIIKGIHDYGYKIFILFYNYFNIIEEFKEYNCEVVIKNSHVKKKRKKQNSSSSAIKKENKLIKWTKFNFNWIKLLPDITFIIKIIKMNKVDIIHCNDRFSTNLAGIIAGKIMGKKVIVHQRQYENKLPYFYILWSSKVDIYFAISTSVKENLMYELNISEQRIEVLHNWVSDKPKCELLNTDAEVKKKLLWVGRIVPWKGTRLLIDIAEKIINTNLEVSKIIIYGEPDSTTVDYYQEVKNKISNKKFDHFFEFRGYKSFSEIDPNEFLAYIHTSLKPEPFGRTIIEAMNKGIPVFATNLGGVLDIIRDNENGFLYDSQKLDMLVNKIKLITDYKIRNKIIQNAFGTLSLKFSGTSQIETIIKNYDSF